MSTKDKVAKALNEGMNVGEAAEVIGVHRNSVSYHKKTLGAIEPESMQEYRAEVLLKLAEIESLVSDPSVDKIDKAKVLLDVVKQLRAIYGTDQPTRSIQARIDADVDPEQLVGYRRFVYETRGLSSDQIDELYRRAREMPRPDVIDHAPPQESEMWEEGS